MRCYDLWRDPEERATFVVSLVNRRLQTARLLSYAWSEMRELLDKHILPTINEHRYFIVHPVDCAIHPVDCVVHPMDCVVHLVDFVVHLVDFVVHPVSDLQRFRNRHPSLFHSKSIRLLQRVLNIVLTK